jgi:hypothetical protein
LLFVVPVPRAKELLNPPVEELSPIAIECPPFVLLSTGSDEPASNPINVEYAALVEFLPALNQINVE